MLDTLGWIGSLLLAGCGIPEAYKAWRTGEAPFTWSFLLMWYFGEIFVLLPVVLEIQTPYLIFNYGLNVVAITVILKYKTWPRREL